MFASILIVEDEPSVREILSWRLKEEGYLCDEASSGNRAIELIKNGYSYDLILSDIRMPGMSGIELLKRVRQIDENVAVIMVTAISDMSIAISTLKIGAFDYITKPFNLDEVVISIERALEKRNLILKNREYQLYLEEKVEEQTKEIKNLYLDAIKSLVNALEAKDKYTEGHSRRVTKYAEEIAQFINLPREQIRKIHLAGLLHDIGKIGIKESILNKPTTLNYTEFSSVYDHPEISARILSPVLRDHDVLRYVRHHHESWDGTGRPDGLKGDQIPIGARVLTVADAFDAITSDRPYRKARTVSFALQEIKRCSGTQFDPSIVKSFTKFVEKYFKGIDYLRPIVEDIFPELKIADTNLDHIIEKR